jgi:hypothetical protein
VEAFSGTDGIGLFRKRIAAAAGFRGFTDGRQEQAVFRKT